MTIPFFSILKNKIYKFCANLTLGTFGSEMFSYILQIKKADRLLFKDPSITLAS